MYSVKVDVMSLDLTLKIYLCKHCGHSSENFCFNYTYNVSRMWDKIYPEDPGMVYIDGMTGKEAYKKLDHARSELEKNPEEFEKLNPASGWGSYKTFLQWINELIAICSEYPEGVWESWRAFY